MLNQQQQNLQDFREKHFKKLGDKYSNQNIKQEQQHNNSNLQNQKDLQRQQFSLLNEQLQKQGEKSVEFFLNQVKIIEDDDLCLDLDTSNSNNEFIEESITNISNDEEEKENPIMFQQCLSKQQQPNKKFHCLSVREQLNKMFENKDKYIQYVSQFPLQYETSIKKLCKFISCTEQLELPEIDSQLQIIYRIYVFLHYNITYSLEGRNDPQSVLKQRYAKCQGYAETFQALCDELDIDCDFVSGASKGAGYFIGKKFDSKDYSDHAWNAVKFDGNYYLVDATWGSGSSKDGKYEKKLDNFYFFTDPDIFIESHFPKDKKWQLVEQKWDLQKFLSSVRFNSRFYEYELEFLDGVRLGSYNVIRNKDIVLKLKNIRNNRVIMYMCSVYIQEQEYQFQEIGGYSFCQVHLEDKYASDIMLKFPKNGIYLVKVFGKEQNNPGSYSELFEVKFDVQYVENFLDPKQQYREDTGFPEILGQFSEKLCYLYTPWVKNFKLMEGKQILMIKVPGALAVCEFNNNFKSFLKDEDREDTWYCKVDVTENKQIAIGARFDDGNSYSYLVRYIY